MKAEMVWFGMVRSREPDQEINRVHESKRRVEQKPEREIKPVSTVEGRIKQKPD